MINTFQMLVFMSNEDYINYKGEELSKLNKIPSTSDQWKHTQ